MAKYVLETFKYAVPNKKEVRIYEIGGGTGTLAKNVLVGLCMKQSIQHQMHVYQPPSLPKSVCG